MYTQFSNSYDSDDGYRNGDFVLSKVDKTQLRRFGIDMRVKDFKEKVVKSGKYKVVLTGSIFGDYRHTRVYNYYDFKN